MPEAEPDGVVNCDGVAVPLPVFACEAVTEADSDAVAVCEGVGVGVRPPVTVCVGDTDCVGVCERVDDCV